MSRQVPAAPLYFTITNRRVEQWHPRQAVIAVPHPLLSPCEIQT